MSFKTTEERVDETDSVEITRGQAGKYGYSIKMYAPPGRMLAKIDAIDELRQRIEKRLYGEKSPEPAKKDGGSNGTAD